MVTAKPSPELAELSKRWQEAFQAGDETFAPAHMAHGDVTMFGSAAGEVFRGRDEILALTPARSKEINEEAGLSSDPDPDATREGWEAGDAGWVVVHGNWRMADGSTVPTRAITVYARDEDGSWKAVFGAAHVLVPNEALQPQSPAYAVLTEGAPARI
jgi:ketosteroid isomerase-like protein